MPPSEERACRPFVVAETAVRRTPSGTFALFVCTVCIACIAWFTPRAFAQAPPAESAEDTEDAQANEHASEPVAATDDAEPTGDIVDETFESESAIGSFIQENVAIHGFGNWHAGITRAEGGVPTNDYKFGDHDGNLGNLDFSLRQLVRPIPELSLAAGQSFVVENGEVRVELDLAGAQWTPNEWFTLRAGRILTPMGAYTEIFRVGTLRPFGTLPTSIYAGAGVIPQSYDGVEVAFTFHADSGWGGRLGITAGRARIDRDGAIVRTLEGLGFGMGSLPYGAIQSQVIMNAMVGFHLRLDTPIDGLTFAYGMMASPRGFTDISGDPNFQDNYNNVVMVGGASFLRDRFELRSEVAYRRNHDPDTTDPINTPATLIELFGLYVEGSYRATEHVQLALRIERMHQIDANLSATSYASVLDSNDFGAVASYWFSRDFVMKLEYHFIDGNRFAHPTEENLYAAASFSEQFGTPSQLSRRTHFIGFTSAFSF